MRFNNHYDLEGQHAFLGASQHAWLRYDEDHLRERYTAMQAMQKGTELHELARQCIKMGVKLPRNNKTLNAYVNDAIGYHMTPEQPLYYSKFCFGTADAISFKDGFLRIHDLKTGVIPASMEQLMIYTALFCLEYDYKPSEISAELRIYQSDDIRIHEPAVDEIAPIMDKIVVFDKILTKMELEGGI